jgi:hypothetical protein
MRRFELKHPLDDGAFDALQTVHRSVRVIRHPSGCRPGEYWLPPSGRTRIRSRGRNGHCVPEVLGVLAAQPRFEAATLIGNLDSDEKGLLTAVLD